MIFEPLNKGEHTILTVNILIKATFTEQLQKQWLLE